jgi:myo-inositol 2-dehydrogenase / D-chiro-inositol 1-dehydrogenase
LIDYACSRVMLGQMLFSNWATDRQDILSQLAEERKPVNTEVETKTIAVGVIGTGGMGTRHAVNLHRYLGGARVAAVYDVDAERARQAAAQSAAPLVMTDPRALIEDASVDAVLIASPDETHVEMTLACLEAGKPVLCEKPLATRVEDAYRVLEAETALGRKLISVGFMRRFDPRHRAVKSAATSGELGKPLLFKGVHRNASVAYGITGATILTNSAGHDFDSARWMLGEEVVEVSVRGLLSRPNLHPDTRDLLLINLKMTNNCLAAAEVFVNDDYGYEVSAELVCQRGTAVTTQPELALVRANGRRGFGVANDWLSPFQDAYVAELVDWIASIQSGEAFQGATAWDGFVVMQVTNACIRSLQTGETVKVDLPPKPALYG